jgi:hypothetical protein
MLNNSVNRTGFEQTNYGLYVTKDPAAELTYTLDWSEWLEDGDTVSTATWSVRARRNDPTPVNVVNNGIANSTETYVTLSGGQADKNYVVTVEIDTANGLTDSRYFTLQVKERPA